MDKLPMCRICLVEDVNMYVVVNKNLHELYEKLTDIPFVTKDSRPILACFFCCTKLKQCFRFLRKCVEAEELFAQMMNGDYEPKPSIGQDNLYCCTGFVKSPTVHLSIVDECETDSIAIKKEVPAVCESQDDVIEPKYEEYQSDDVDLEILNNTLPGTEDIIPPHISESDSRGDVKIEVEEEQELSRKKRRAVENNSLQVLAALPQDMQLVQQTQDKDHMHNMPQVFITPNHQIIINAPDNRKLNNNTTSDNNTHGHTHAMDTVIIKDEPEESNDDESSQGTESGETMQWQLNPCHQQELVKYLNTLPPQQTQALPVSLQQFLRLNTTDVKKSEPVEIKTEMDDVTDDKKEEPVAEAVLSEGAPVTKKPKLDTRRTRLKDTITEVGLKKNEQLKLTAHNQIHTGENLHKCNLCQRSFCDKGSLTKHIRIHTGEKPYQCDVCERSFSFKYLLTQHIRIHTGEKPYQCNVCQRSFCDKGRLSKHIRIHTGEKPYQCDVCERSFSKKANLTQHFRIHTGEKPYQCDVCQHSFKQSSDLTRHIRIHTGEKPYQCEVCQSSFKDTGTLIKHKRIHTGEKPYQCEVCQRRYREKRNLTIHIRLHTGEKPFQCEVCQRSFKNKGSLIKHNNRIHTGKKPYRCEICPRSYSAKRNLATHIRLHTGEKPYQCDVCHCSFRDKSCLNKHNRIHTGENPVKVGGLSTSHV